MELVLQNMEVFEDTDSGDVMEQFTFSGGEFLAGDKALALQTFNLQLLRDAEGYLEAILIEVDPVPAELWRELAKAVPLDPQAIPADHVGKVSLEFDGDLLEALAPYMADAEGIEDLLCLADEDEQLYFFNLAHYSPSEAVSTPTD